MLSTSGAGGSSGGGGGIGGPGASAALRFANGAVVSQLGAAGERVGPLAKVFSITRLTEKPRGRVSRDSQVLSSIIFPTTPGEEGAGGGGITLPSGAWYVGGYVGGGPRFVTSSEAGLAGGHPSTAAPHLVALKAEVGKVRALREQAQHANSELALLVRDRNVAVGAEERRHLMETSAMRDGSAVADAAEQAASTPVQRAIDQGAVHPALKETRRAVRFHSRCVC